MSTPIPSRPVPSAPDAVSPQTTLAWVFVSRSGELRAGWRLLLYVAMVALLAWLLRILSGIVAARFHIHPPAGAPTLRPGLEIVSEAIVLLVVLLPAIIMGRVERRTLGDYGLPLRGPVGKQFLTGSVWGLLLISAVIGGIALFHGYDFGGLSLAGPAIAEYGCAWLVGFVLVGLFEEFTFRGYTQFTLGSGIGFWPAAVLLSAAFGAVHLTNPGEGWVGALQVFQVAMFFCLTLRLTGNLWFAIGAHAMFDWGETFLYSVPNSGLIAAGHLSASSLHGARWLTGGTVGPEGSVICFVCVFLAIVLFAWIKPGVANGRAG
jgi:membrane protease YdiL (CAAX protease family)